MRWFHTVPPADELVGMFVILIISLVLRIRRIKKFSHDRLTPRPPSQSPPPRERVPTTRRHARLKPASPASAASPPPPGVTSTSIGRCRRGLSHMPPHGFIPHAYTCSQTVSHVSTMAPHASMCFHKASHASIFVSGGRGELACSWLVVWEGCVEGF